MKQKVPSHFVIMSDANTVFIDTILKYHDLDIFDQIYTNPSAFDENELLKLQPFFDSPHGCQRCEVNLCKGTLMKRVKDKKSFRRILYIGDGENDYCKEKVEMYFNVNSFVLGPSLELSTQDVLLPRKNFRLSKMIQKEEHASKLNCAIKEWNSYDELVEHLQNILVEIKSE